MSKNKYKNKRERNRRRGLLFGTIFIGLILILVGFNFLPGQKANKSDVSDVEGTPILKADKEQIDFGDVKFNEIVTASFELTNVGDGTLRFTEKPYIELKEGC